MSDFDLELEDMTLDDIQEEIFETKEALIDWVLDDEAIEFDYKRRTYLINKLNKLWKIEERITNL